MIIYTWIKFAMNVIMLEQRRFYARRTRRGYNPATKVWASILKCKASPPCLEKSVVGPLNIRPFLSCELCCELSYHTEYRHQLYKISIM